MVEQKAPYLYRKRGVYYLCRRLPEDLKEHYKQSKIAFSLRTKSSRVTKLKLLHYLLNWMKIGCPYGGVLKALASEGF